MTRTRYPIIVALLFLSGCQGWRQVAKPSAGGSLEGNPDIVRVTRTAGCGATPTLECVASRGTVTLYNPRVQGDSLIGYYDRNQRERVAMHVRDVVSVESRKTDTARTAGAALGTGALIALAAVVVAVALLAGGSSY
jgi:hypothetical protein